MNKKLSGMVCFVALLGAACGGGGDASATDGEPEDASPTTEAVADATVAPAVDDEVAADEEAADESSDAEPTDEAAASAPVGEWDGGDAAALLEARMDELASVFGQPMSVESLAPLFPIADDFPYRDGSITGVFRIYDRDRRVTDEIDIEEERLIGTDADPSTEALDAIADQMEADAAGRWSRSSSQRQEGQIFNDLFTAEDGDGDGNKDRIVLKGDPDREDGEPLAMAVIESSVLEIPTPSWAAGLPKPEGGELDFVREGRGEVSAFGGRLGGDGNIEIRWFYPPERFDEIGEYLSSGVVTAAGFTDEGSTASNLSFRTDVSLDGWEGVVAVGDVVINDELVGHHLIWSLSRP